MPMKADHNRTHLLIVHSPCLVSPLCTGWRKEDHAARPQAWRGSAFLPFFASFSNRKGSSRCRLTSFVDGPRIERAECLATDYSDVCLEAAGLFGFDWRLSNMVYCILEEASRPHRRKFSNAV